MKRPIVFISYAREDREHAERLYSFLLAEQCEPWLDIKALRPGQHWKVEIGQAIEKSNFFLALLSKHSVTKKGYFQKELLEGIKCLEQTPLSRPYFIPARIDNCQPMHPILADLQWVDLFPKPDQGIRQILSTVLEDHANRTSDQAERAAFFALYRDDPGKLGRIATFLAQSSIYIVTLLSKKIDDAPYASVYIDVFADSRIDASALCNKARAIPGMVTFLAINREMVDWSKRIT